VCSCAIKAFQINERIITIFHTSGEWHDGRVSGLHYWMKYQLEESEGKINYLGYKNAVKIGKVG